jgi:hypothetical protein
MLVGRRQEAMRWLLAIDLDKFAAKEAAPHKATESFQRCRQSSIGREVGR